MIYLDFCYNGVMFKKKNKDSDNLIDDEIQEGTPGDSLWDDDDEAYDDDIPDPTQMDFEQVKSSYLGTFDLTGGLPDAAKVTAAILDQKQKEEKERVMSVIRSILCVLGFCGITMCMAEYGNVRATEMEVFYSRLSMFFFVAVLWAFQRVRLFNWQSLLLSLAFVPYAVFYPMVEGKTPTNVMVIVTELVTRWMVLMLITDIALAKKLRSNHRFVPWSFALLCITAIFTLINGNGGFAPVVYLYFILMCFIPLAGKDWEKILDCLFYTMAATFVLVTVFTFTGNPMMIIPRDFYMLIDDLGQFYGLCMGIATFGLIRFGKKYGRISFSYFLAAAWLIGCVIMCFYKGCDAVLPGVLITALVIFLFGPKMGKFPVSLIRPVIALLVVGGMVAGIIAFANQVNSPNFDTEAFAEGVMNSPLKLFANTAEDLIGKVETVHRGGGGYGELIKPGTLGAFFNVFMDSRIGIFFETIGALNWDGHILVGVNADSFVMATKNQYIQYLYEFGYFGGGLNIIFYVSIWIASIVQYARHKKERFLLPMLLLSMMIGVWFNASSGIFYPITFFSLFAAYPLLVDFKGGKSKKKVKTEKKDEEKSAEGKKEKPEEGKKEKPAEGKKEKSAEGKKEKPAEGKKEKSAEGKKEKPAEGKKEKSAEGKKEKSAEGKKEKSAEGKKEKSAEGKKEKPAEENKEKSSSKVPEFVKLETIELLPVEPEKVKKKEYREIEGRPVDRKLLEDEEIISIDVVSDKKE